LLQGAHNLSIAHHGKLESRYRRCIITEPRGSRIDTYLESFYPSKFFFTLRFYI
jgi:hypothetical protein